MRRGMHKAYYALCMNDMLLIEEAKQKLKHLTPDEWKALEAIVTRLHEIYGQDLIRVVLFGSKARGDFDDESDLDLLIVVRMKEADYDKHWLRILDNTWEIELKYGIVTTMIIKSLSQYKRMVKHGLLLAKNISTDGIVLWTRQPERLTYDYG